MITRRPEHGRPGVIMQRVILRAAAARPVPGNAVGLSLDAAALDAMIETVEQATQWVHFENYIIRDDETGERFARALVGAAAIGVTVRVLYDWLGSRRTSGRYWARLRDAGIEVRTFNPPRVLDVLANFSRNHRKLVVADGAAAVVGGMCIGNEWAGDAAEGVRAWRDTAVRVAGPGAAALDQSFAAVWQLAKGQIPAQHRATEVPARGDASVQVVAGVPGRARVFRILELLATGSVERLWITDAYLVAPRRLARVFVEAAEAGVDVRLLVPGTSDLPIVRNVSRVGYRDLLRAGVRIFEWQGPMLHAKSVVVDGRWVRIGSSNLNPSSLLGNYELDLLIDDAVFAAAIEQQFRRDIARSVEIVHAPSRRRPLEQVLPGVLALEAPEVLPARHQRTLLERRRQAVVALRTVASAARRSLFGPLSLGLVLLGVLFFILPRVTGYVFGGLLLWLALGAGFEAFRRRAR